MQADTANDADETLEQFNETDCECLQAHLVALAYEPALHGKR